MEPNPIQPLATSTPDQTDPSASPTATQAGQVIQPADLAAPPEVEASPPSVEPANPAPERPMAVAKPAVTGANIGTESYTFTPEEPSQTPAAQTAATPKAKRKFFKSHLIIAVLAVLLLFGSSAGAYFGYYVPSKPENKLAKAFANSLQQSQATTKGTIDITTDGISTKIEYTAAANEANHALNLKLNATISGVTIPLEATVVNNNLYFKVGDLSSLEGLLSVYAGQNDPEFKKQEDKINKSITNQWFVVDSTLVKEAKLSCLASYPMAFSQTDVQQLQAAYKQASFVTINSLSSDNVAGAATTKYQLQIDDNTLSKLDLNSVSYFKKLNDCLKTADQGGSLSLNSLKDNDKTSLTLWVDKKTNLIVKYSTISSAKDKTKGVEGEVTGTISYDKVNIAQPANAKPVLNLLNEINLNSLFGGANSSNPSDSGLPTILN